MPLIIPLTLGNVPFLPKLVIFAFLEDYERKLSQNLLFKLLNISFVNVLQNKVLWEIIGITDIDIIFGKFLENDKNLDIFKRIMKTNVSQIRI